MSRHSKKQHHGVDLLQDPVRSTLLKMTAPMALGFLSIFSISFIDAFFVSKLGIQALAAISFITAPTMLVMQVGFALSISVSAVLSKVLGSNNRAEGCAIVISALLLTFLLTVLIAAVGFVTIAPTFLALGASPELLPMITDYMQIWYISVVAVCLPIVGNSALRASGDSMTPGLMMALSALLNLILDPLLIFGLGPFPRLELAGAAIATSISYGTALIWGLIVLTRRQYLSRRLFPRLVKMLALWRRLLYIAIPSLVGGLLTSIAGAVVLKIVSNYGIAPVAAMGVIVRIEPLALLAIIAMLTVIVPFIGQNLGAGSFDRIAQGMTFAAQYTLFCGLISAVILMLFSSQIAVTFSSSVEAQELIRTFLLIIPLSFGCVGIALLAMSICNGFQMPLRSLLIAVFRFYGLAIPCIIIGAELFGPIGIALGLSLGQILSGSSLLWVRYFVFPKILSANRAHYSKSKIEATPA